MRTPHQILGPFFPQGLRPATQGDLTIVEGVAGHAQGEIIEVRGRVLDDKGNPVAGARLSIWQANSFGRYCIQMISTPRRWIQTSKASPPFNPARRRVSDQDREARTYPVGPDWMRAPHIHLEVQGQFERLITQMYFPGEPLNASIGC
jgi:Protocatechuate 3,4-dioxygenase beta subunit